MSYKLKIFGSYEFNLFYNKFVNYNKIYFIKNKRKKVFFLSSRVADSNQPGYEIFSWIMQDQN